MDKLCWGARKKGGVHFRAKLEKKAGSSKRLHDSRLRQYIFHVASRRLFHSIRFYSCLARRKKNIIYLYFMLMMYIFSFDDDDFAAFAYFN